jgi:hypothetical protein
MFLTEAVMPNLIENVRSWTPWKKSKDWLIDMANAPPHNSGRAQKCAEASRAERLPHPADIPDVTPNDFFLFGYIKGKLSVYICESREDLVNAITEIFTGVDPEMLLSVFESWVTG